MKKKITGVGWDVGGWMGKKQGLAIAFWEEGNEKIEWPGYPRNVSLSGLTGVPEFDEFLNRYFSKSFLKGYITLAVDAPVSFPLKFQRLICGEKIKMGFPNREIDNPLAYRETDRFVFNEFGKKPLSASFDRLGNSSSVALTFIRNWQKNEHWILNPSEQKGRKNIIEVYPALVKENSGGPAFSGVSRHIPPEVDPGTDAYDAAICALLAIAYGASGSFPDLPPLKDPPEKELYWKEGWIYHWSQQQMEKMIFCEKH